MLKLEAKCPIFPRPATPPNLDVLLLQGSGRVVGIDSKLTEYLTGTQAAKFASRYAAAVQEFADTPWRTMYQLLTEQPDRYRWLNAAQLVKHALGLRRCANGANVTLLYAYWEPCEPHGDAAFAEHREEIRDFAAVVSESALTFEAIAYVDLWNRWAELSNDGDELDAHVRALRGRYDVRI